MSREDLLRQGLSTIDLARSIISGDRPDPLEIARALADLSVQFVSTGTMKVFLDDAAKRRVEAAVDVFEDVKFPR